MGDLFWFDDAFQSISSHYKQPVTLLTKCQSRADKVYEGSSYIKEILWLDDLMAHKGVWGIFRLAQLMRRRGVTDVWVLHKSWRYRCAAFLGKVTSIHMLPKETHALHPTQRFSKMAAVYGVQHDDFPKFPLSRQAIKKVAAHVPAKGQPSVVFAIGGTEAYKKWPVENWIALGKYFSEKKYTVSVLGGPSETEEAAAIAVGVGGKKVKAYTRFTIQESLAFIDAHDFVVGNDTGIMNGAAVLNKPTFGLFMASPPLQYRPCLMPVLPNKDGLINVQMVQDMVCQSFTR
ncbi:MAG: glycosyltransferase family 9 protein [Holosporaceae bacterium]|nr:MAG: glycosyltransferase family 9 protein [Holosporaceae bacterium]